MSDTTSTTDPASPDQDREAVAVDADAIFAPAPPTFELGDSGITVRVRRIYLVEFMALMNVLNTGLAGSLSQVRLRTTNTEAAVEDLLGLAMLAIPRATSEFLLFLISITEPAEGSGFGRSDVTKFWQSGEVDPAVMLDVFERLAVQEAPHVVALAGKAQAMMTRLQRTLQAQRRT